MEAAIRTVADVLTGKDLKEFEYNAVRGIAEIKEAQINLDGKIIKVAVAHSAKAAGELMERVKAGEADYHFIEVMCCSGGCINGGGQPHISNKTRLAIDVRKERAKALYTEDESRKFRKSHKNPDIVKIYKDFLGEPNGHKAHKYLHTTYEAKKKYGIKA